MRIEHQGYLEVQPAYQHVGYCSAALSNAYAGVASTGALATTVLLLISLTLALRLRNRAGYVAAGAILVLGVGAYAAWGTVTIRDAARAQAAIDMRETMQRLEVACASAEEWDAKENGPLTPEAWKRRWGHGRGRDYELKLLTKPGADGQRYVLVSKPAAEQPKGPQQDIPSTWLGPDGLYATPDDDPRLTELLLEWSVRQDRSAKPVRETRKAVSP